MRRHQAKLRGSGCGQDTAPSVRIQGFGSGAWGSVLRLGFNMSSSLNTLLRHGEFSLVDLSPEPKQPHGSHKNCALKPKSLNNWLEEKALNPKLVLR